MMRRPLMPALLAVVLVVGACSSDGGTATEGAPVPAGAPGDALTIADLRDAAEHLVGRHGADEAFAVVVVALDRGYAVETIVANVEDLDYVDWSTPVLPDAYPDGPPQGLIERPEIDGARESGLGPAGPTTVDVELVAVAGQFRSSEARDLRVAGLGLMLGELFRQSQEEYDGRAPSPAAPADDGPVPPAGSDGAAAGDGRLTDRAVLEAVLVLSARGYSLEQVVLALATGDLGKEGISGDCWYLPGESPEGGREDRLVGACTPLDAIPGTDEPSVRTDDPDGPGEVPDDDGGGRAGTSGDDEGDEELVDRFCGGWASLMTSTGGDLASLSIHELAQTWIGLTDVAPPEIRADMERVQRIWDRGVATGTDTSLYESTGPDASAVANVEIYVDEVCGIDLGGD